MRLPRCCFLKETYAQKVLTSVSTHSVIRLYLEWARLFEEEGQDEERAPGEASAGGGQTRSPADS